MNETRFPDGHPSPPPPDSAQPQFGPPPGYAGPQAPSGQQFGQRFGQPGQQFGEIRRLRRSATDRRIAGVAGGLGEHFNVDPTVIRVLLAVLVFFGGAGLFLYAALWLLVPDQQTGRAVLGTGEDLLKVLLIGAGVIALMLVVGATGPFFGMGMGPGMDSGTDFGDFLAGLAVFALLTAGVVAVIRAMRGSNRPAGPPPGQFVSGPTAVPGVPVTAPAAYVPPARPVRTGPVLLWPTLAVLAIALGSLGLADAQGFSPAPGLYPVVALVIIGLALVVGAFVGRPGGLIFAGLIAGFSMLVSTLVGQAGGYSAFQEPTAESVTAASADEVPDRVEFRAGTYVLDMSGIDPDELDGRSVTILGRGGEIEVIVPDDVSAEVSASVSMAGEISVGEFNRSGPGLQVNQELPAIGATDRSITLNLDLRVGQITVRHP